MSIKTVINNLICITFLKIKCTNVSGTYSILPDSILETYTFNWKLSVIIQGMHYLPQHYLANPVHNL